MELQPVDIIREISNRCLVMIASSASRVRARATLLAEPVDRPGHDGPSFFPWRIRPSAGVDNARGRWLVGRSIEGMIAAATAPNETTAAVEKAPNEPTASAGDGTVLGLCHVLPARRRRRKTWPNRGLRSGHGRFRGLRSGTTGRHIVPLCATVQRRGVLRAALQATLRSAVDRLHPKFDGNVLGLKIGDAHRTPGNRVVVQNLCSSANIPCASCVSLHVSGIRFDTNMWMIPNVPPVGEIPAQNRASHFRYAASTRGRHELHERATNSRYREREAQRRTIARSAAAFSPALLTPDLFITTWWNDEARCRQTTGPCRFHGSVAETD